MHVLAALLLLAAAPDPGRPRLPPADTCAAAPGFTQFRAELQQAIDRKDVAGLLAHTDPGVLLSFGEEKGHADLRRMWKLDRPGESEIWQELGEILRLGCALDNGVAIAPALAHDVPEGYEIYDVMIAVRPGSPLRTAPDEKAAAVTSLDWDLMQIESWDETTNWIKARLKDGSAGYVRPDEVRSPIDYRATFERKSGKWAMTILIAGD